MKRIICIIAVTALSIGLCACTVNITIDNKSAEDKTKNECPEEATDDFLEEVADESAPDIDISGCDTFTQIVDGKLSDGMAYANEKIGDEDVLLVSSFAYDNLDGNMASIDATIFMYDDGVPVEIGKICSGGTAYPIAVKNGSVYTASNHWVCKYTIENGKIVPEDKAAVEYDENGNGTYYRSQKQFEALFDEMFDAKIVNFSTVGGDVSK